MRVVAGRCSYVRGFQGDSILASLSLSLSLAAISGGDFDSALAVYGGFWNFTCTSFPKGWYSLRRDYFTFDSETSWTVSQAAFNWTILSCVHMFIYSIAWSSWVPYAAAMFSILFVSHNPVYIEGLIESVVVPLELLQQLKLSDFTDQQEYEEWQKRTLKVLKMTNLRKKRSSSSRKSKEYRSKLFIQPH